MAAVVTRDHRTAVIVAENGHGLASPIQFEWIQNGGDEVLDRYAQALVDAEARGRAESSAEVARLTAEVERLSTLLAVADDKKRQLAGRLLDARSGTQANEGPVGADRAGLELDLKTVRFFVELTIAGGVHPSGAPQALARIAAALGVKEP